MIIFRFIKTCHASLASVCLIYIFHLVHIFIIRILIHILVVSSSGSGSIIIFIIIIFSYPLTSSLLSLLLCDVYRHKRNRHHWFHIGFLIMLLFSLTQQVFLLCKSVGESHTAQWCMGVSKNHICQISFGKRWNNKSTILSKSDLYLKHIVKLHWNARWKHN